MFNYLLGYLLSARAYVILKLRKIEYERAMPTEMTPSWANKKLSGDERALVRQFHTASDLNKDIRKTAECPDAIQVPSTAKVQQLKQDLSEKTKQKPSKR